MFTGIIEAQGCVFAVQEVRGVRKIEVRVPVPVRFTHGVKQGTSVAVDGVCLTVVKKDKVGLTFELMHPTISRTTLGKKKVGDMVNLEHALRMGDELGGHFVFGHVDGIGRIKNVKCKMKNDTLLTVSVSDELARYFVPRGSVAINGVSLTIVSVNKNHLVVGLIPYTLAHTNLGILKVGEKVNLEVDMLAKYVEKLLTTNR